MDKEMANNDTVTETPVEPEETTVDDTEEETEGEQDKQFDFASELQRMESNFEKKLSKMQKAIARDKYKERQESKKEEPAPRRRPVQEPDESSDDFETRYQQMRERERAEERLETAESRVAQLTSDPDEAKLILKYMESFGPDGDFDEDLENAYLLANKQRIKAQSSNILKTLQSRSLAGNGARASLTRADRGTGGKLSQADKQRLESSGFKQTKPGRWESQHLVAIINKDGTITTKKK
jgi:hypothetical protein